MNSNRDASHEVCFFGQEWQSLCRTFSSSINEEVGPETSKILIQLQKPMILLNISYFKADLIHNPIKYRLFLREITYSNMSSYR